ncbi:MAG: N-acetyltransferase [Acidobacteria bacterium]|nr:N-acetyltransferase [Acidobacteriota bacterium]MBI3278497.1 N-acetyltransferase [Acidobacteriota bacterium]
MRNFVADQSQEASRPDAVIAVRKATMADLPSLLDLINGYAAGGLMLPRTELEMSESIRDFSVAEAGGRLQACGALHFYTPFSGEVRSLAVNPAAKGQGLGRRLLETLEAEARVFNLHSIFAFTYVSDFFRRLGFVEVERGELPLKAWRDCFRCPKFSSCDEIAVVKYLVPPNRALMHHPAEWQEQAPLPILKR